MTAILMKDGHRISLERISDLLCGALEGGSNYWYTIDKAKSVKPPKFDFTSCKEEPGRYFHLDWPLNEGGSLSFFAKGSPGKVQKQLTLTEIQAGLEIMKDKFPIHWAAFMDENDDAVTSDVFLQCCLFGEVVYG